MSAQLSGGCAHVHVTAKSGPIDNHVCHCNVCKAVTGQQTTHVAFFNYGDLNVDHPEKLKRVPFNANNPDGPLEICVCTDCGAAIMLDDKQKRIRVAVPNVMGYDDASFPAATYHAFWDESKGYEKPHDGRPVYDSLRPDFVWPKGA
ncbi:MAG: GFA family protein [Paracoccaceae bacterium]